MRTSYSQLARAEECLRKYAFGACDRLYEPQKKSAADGDTVHALNEGYVKYGLAFPHTRLGKLCELAIDHLPTRADAPITEVKDWVKYGGHEISARADVLWQGPFAPVVMDYKTCDHFGWALNAARLRMDLQANINCYYAMQKYDTEEAVAFWLYYRRPKETDPSDVGEIRPVETVIELEGARRVLRARQDLLKQMDGLRVRPTSALNVVGNRSACGNFGGCWYRHKCDPDNYVLSEDQKKAVERGPVVEYRERPRARA
jgi:hypothetical protein